MSNESLIRKADMAIADLTSNGGLLNPEMADTFLRTIMEQPTVLNSARFVTMNAPTRKINKIGIGSRILRKAVSATALADNQRFKPDQSQIRLDTTEVIAELHLPYEVLEDNIEGGSINTSMGGNPGGLMSTIVALIGERAALDLEELALLGDKDNLADDYLALQDGWLKLCSAHTVDVQNATVTKDIFKAAQKALPPKYLRNKSQMVYFLSTDNEVEYRDTVANRGTALGDATLQGTGDVYAFGSKLIGAPMMPNPSGLYVNPNNLIFGIQRQVTMEFDKDIRSRQYIVVLTARVAVQVEETDAVVKFTNLG